LIKFLGEKLAKKIDSKDDHGTSQDLTIQKIKHTLDNGLRKRLTSIKVQNLDEVIEYLTKKLLENQALLTMTNF